MAWTIVLPSLRVHVRERPESSVLGLIPAENSGVFEGNRLERVRVSKSSLRRRPAAGAFCAGRGSVFFERFSAAARVRAALEPDTRIVGSRWGTCSTSSQQRPSRRSARRISSWLGACRGPSSRCAACRTCSLAARMPWLCAALSGAPTSSPGSSTSRRCCCTRQPCSSSAGWRARASGRARSSCSSAGRGPRSRSLSRLSSSTSSSRSMRTQVSTRHRRASGAGSGASRCACSSRRWRRSSAISRSPRSSAGARACEFASNESRCITRCS
jgi:hypothetical protein